MASNATTDADGDGLLNVFEVNTNNDGFDVNDEDIDGDDGGADGSFTRFDFNSNDPDLLSDGSNAIPLDRDFDYRDATDTDGDGVVDSIDVDDDNDGILDVNEAQTVHTPANASVVNANPPIANLATTHDGTSTAGSSFASVDLASNYDVLDRVIYDFSTPLSNVTEMRLWNNDDPSADGIDFIGYVQFFDAAGNQLLEMTNISVTDGADPFVLTLPTSLNNVSRMTWFSIDSIDPDTGDYSSNMAWREVALVTGGDSDNDGIVDRLDLDSDNDGITDNVEAQATNAYIAPSGTGANGGAGGFIDANGDGLDDNYDDRTVIAATAAATSGAGNGAGLTPVDTDSTLASSDNVADYLDTDSDNDGVSDQAESGLTAATSSDDTDNDGLLDDYEGGNDNDGFDVNDENISGDNGGATGSFTGINLPANNPDLAADGSNAQPLTRDFDYRDATDTDGDGVVDSVDIDDDNDGILDTVENSMPAHRVSITGLTSIADRALIVVSNTGGVSGYGIATSAFHLSDDAGQVGSLAGEELDIFPGDTRDFYLVGATTDGPGGPGLEHNGTVLGVHLQVTNVNGSLQYTIVESIRHHPGVGDWATRTYDSLPDASGYTVFSNNFSELFEINPLVDFDGDGIINSLDIDSDNDGITDNVEAQTTAGYIAPSGVGGTPAFLDANGDGLDGW